MDKMLIYFLMTLVLISAAFGQSKMSIDSNVEEQIIALERAGWKAWKDKDPSWYRTNTTEDVMLINSSGVANKTQMIKDLSTCDVRSFALDDFKLVMLSRDAVLMTYTATQDGVCAGEKIPARVRSTVNYVRRGGRWLEAMYMEMPIAEQTSEMHNDRPETFALRPAVEKEYGYIHAMRIGNDLKISGAVSMDDKGMLVAPGNLEQQMKNCYSDLEKILKHYGYTFDDVTVENVFTTDMAGFIKVSGHRNSIYKNGFPTGTWLEVKGLALPGQLIEIDMEAHKAK
jgi:enamine deaminase RidA (YjgF/YER057c/UK114 family)